MNQTTRRGLTVVAGAWVSLAAAGGLGGCNNTPVADLQKSFTLQVQQDSGTGDPIKIDFLWVVDNSSSMCEEQVSLTSSFTQFTDQLASFFQIDARVAVTTHDAQCDPNGSNIFSSKGLFNSVPATAFPPPCQERRIRRCFADSACANMDCVIRGECDIDDPDCTCAGTLGEWECKKPNTETCLVNPNNTVNSACTRRCVTDEECQQLFGDLAYKCQKPSSNQDDWGCILPPKTSECPATVGPVLEGDDLKWFGCAATVGVNQEKCLKYEQGMRSALMALDPTGINAEQARAFLRDDAYLVIIFISDEDDCSAAEGKTINEDNFETCALLPTTEVGGPLTPVGHFVNRFKSLKQDPGRVIVAAIAGDAIGGSPAEISAERELYLSSKGNPKVCYHQSYICLSDNGKADYGARYLALTESFGPNGVFTNICDNEGIGPALDAIAATIIQVLNKVCLPKPITGALTVKRTNADGTVDVLTEGTGPGTYQVLLGAEDCAVDGTLMPAIAFGDPPSPGEEITIIYEGDPQLD